MFAYIIRRLLLIIPTLLGIVTVNFLIIQAAPGGPVEQALAKLKGDTTSAVSRFTQSEGAEAGGTSNTGQSLGGGASDSKYRGSRGIEPELIADIEKQYGFDKPVHERFVKMLKDYVRFDFGTSFYREVSIPLGIRKATHDGSSFDVWTSSLVIIGNAIPGFLFAVLLIVLFAGGSFLDWFPLRGLTSSNFDTLSWPQKILDYFWHITLPIVAMVIGGFASLTMLTKNSFIEEINKQYVLTARAKGLTEGRVLYGHVFRNAMLIVVAGFPSAFVGILFTGSLLIEIIFSLDGLGLLGFEAAINRDYPVMFGTLFFFTLLGLIMNLIGDLMYTVIDPRIDFESREFI